MLTEQHVYQLELEGFSHAHIQSFYQHVSYARQALPIEAQPDDHKLGRWLLLNIKKARVFEHEVREYKRAKLKSKLRRFSYLWSCIREWLTEQQEDTNASKIAGALARGPKLPAKATPSKDGKVGGATAKAADGTAPPKKGSQWAKAAAAKAAQDSNDPSDTVHAAPAMKAKSKYSKASKAGKAKSKPKGQDTSKMSTEAKSKLPCMHFHGNGTCRFEGTSFYSPRLRPKPPSQEGRQPRQRQRQRSL
jgi:hypothetical protein